MSAVKAVVLTLGVVGGAVLAKFQRSKVDAELGKATFSEYHKQVLAHITTFAEDQDQLIWAGKEYNIFVRSILTSANRPAVKASAIAAAEQWLNSIP